MCDTARKCLTGTDSMSSLEVVSHSVDNHDSGPGRRTGDYKMLKIRYTLIALGMLLCSATSLAATQVSIGIGLPNVNIGINVPAYPELVVVPGYPVYYAPRMEANFFFYDGMYWVYQDDNWYESSWYNGPWWFVDREVVPVFVLRIPVRYYRQPPAFFFGWQSDSPPRWGDHWGRDWEQHRSGWNRWNRSKAHAPAPLPSYQHQYSGERYPRKVEQQHELQQQNYRYQPRDPIVQKHYQEQVAPKSPVQQEKPQQEKQRVPEEHGTRQQNIQPSAPVQQPPPRQQDVPVGSRSQPQQKGGADNNSSTPAIPRLNHKEFQAPVQPQPGPSQHEQQMPRSQAREDKQQDRDTTREQKQGQGQERDRGRDE